MTADDTERLITLIQNPTGDDATIRLRDTYARMLTDRGSEAEECVVRWIESGRATNLPVLLALLAAFGTQRATAVLRHMFESGPEAIADLAAEALASHPTPAALGALREGLMSSKSSVVIAALMALRRVDTSLSCVEIEPLLRNPNRQIRFQASELAWEAGCLSEETIGDLLRGETDRDIRDLLQARLKRLR